jgi:hypothetical protein
VIVVLLVIWGQGCSSDKKRTTYNDYMTEIGDVGTASAKLGADLADLLTTPGLKQAELETSLGGLIQQQQQDLQQARGIDVPGPLHPAHEQPRGPAAASAACRDAPPSRRPHPRRTRRRRGAALRTGAPSRRRRRRLAGPFRRRRPVLKDEACPTSGAAVRLRRERRALLDQVDDRIWQRIHGARRGHASGVHGTGLQYTNVSPGTSCTQGCTGDGQLSTDTEATIRVSTDLGFVVGVTNTGENQEVQVQVTLTVPKGTSPIVKKATIDLIDVGETKTVAFKEFPEVEFGEKTTVQVSVEPVPGEQNKTNNTSEYPVIFSLE